MDSQRLIKRKLDYFYAPYEKQRQPSKDNGERLFNRYMTQKNKKGELSVVTPSGRIRNESKTDRMKRYGKSTVVHKTTKFDEGLLNGSADSKDKAMSKLRESLSFRKKINKTTDEQAEGEDKDNLKANA
jgi:hypothetical protein